MKNGLEQIDKTHPTIHGKIIRNILYIPRVLFLIQPILFSKAPNLVLKSRYMISIPQF